MQVGLYSKELVTDILVDGQTLDVINPKTGQPCARSPNLQAKADKAEVRVDRPHGLFGA